jgi:hypothetical protein
MDNVCYFKLGSNYSYLKFLFMFFSILDILSSVDLVINIKDLLVLFLEFACMMTN